MYNLQAKLDGLENELATAKSTIEKLREKETHLEEVLLLFDESHQHTVLTYCTSAS